MSADVRDFLRRGAAVPEPIWGFESVWRRSRRRRTRSIGLRAVAMVVTLTAVAVGVTSITSADRGGDRNNPVAPAAQASWESIPASPINGLISDFSVWTGEEMLVWGDTQGETDASARSAQGAAFDTQTDTWRSLSDGPLEYADARTAVWTGQEVLIWGGEIGDGSHRRPDNGAAYDPRTDSWRELPRSPIWSLASHSAVWTGTEMIVWGGVDMQDKGAAYNPRSDSWRTIAPGPIEGRHRHAAVWTGTEMIVWGGADEQGRALATGAAYDPVADTWRELPEAPLSERESVASTWTGEEMILWGGQGRMKESDEVESGGGGVAEVPAATPGTWTWADEWFEGAAYNPESDDWRKLARAPVDPTGGHDHVTWTGEMMVLMGAGSEMAAYQPDDDEWVRLPDAPMRVVSSPHLLRANGDVILWGSVWREPGDKQLSNGGGVLHLGD